MVEISVNGIGKVHNSRAPSTVGVAAGSASAEPTPYPLRTALLSPTPDARVSDGLSDGCPVAGVRGGRRRALVGAHKK